LKAGFGVISATWAAKTDDGWKVVTENSAEGGYLVFPKYRVAVKLRSQDLILCDVHECHGVTAITGVPGHWARLSFVFYVRERMNECENAKAEILRTSIADTLNYLKPREVAEDALDLEPNDILRIVF
jgi:hypothetical protein